jgi:hypothetical protein
MAWSDLGAPWPHGAGFWELVIAFEANVLVVLAGLAVYAAFAAVVAAIFVIFVIALIVLLIRESARCSSLDFEGSEDHLRPRRLLQSRSRFRRRQLPPPHRRPSYFLPPERLGYASGLMPPIWVKVGLLRERRQQQRASP